MGEELFEVIFTAALTGIIGGVLITLGFFLWKREKISILHDYHYSKVSEENKSAFCALSGKGLIICGSGLIATSVLFAIMPSPLAFIPFPIFFAIGLSLLIRAGIKYNR